MEKRRIFVTGATGMVGYHVVKHFLSKGDRITACVRTTSNTSQLKSLSGDLTVITTELRDRAALSRAMTGHDVVIHCAGSVNPHARREDIFETNVSGTKAAMDAASNGGVKQFIHVSSLSVITGQEDQFAVDESAPLRYCGEAYADSKVDAEKAVTEHPQRGSMSWTIVRPGFIYGPQERAWMPRLINNLKTKKAMLIDGGGKETNVIYVENLCRAIDLAVLNPSAYGQVYNLTDGQTPTKKELFDTICDGMGFARIQKQIPGAIAKTVCELVSTIAPWLPEEKRQGLSRFSRAAFRLAGVNQGFSIAKAEQELGYTNRIPFTEGMLETLQHFKAQAEESQTPVAVAGADKVNSR
jgi:2-alkyl-3-oxoalkanoate reductase